MNSGAECKWAGYAVIKVAEAKNKFNMYLCVACSCCAGYEVEDVLCSFYLDPILVTSASYPHLYCPLDCIHMTRGFVIQIQIVTLKIRGTEGCWTRDTWHVVRSSLGRNRREMTSFSWDLIVVIDTSYPHTQNKKSRCKRNKKRSLHLSVTYLFILLDARHYDELHQSVFPTLLVNSLDAR